MNFKITLKKFGKLFKIFVFFYFLFFFFLTWKHKTNFRANVHNEDHLRSIILKFKIHIYNSSNQLAIVLLLLSRVFVPDGGENSFDTFNESIFQKYSILWLNHFLMPT